MGICKECSQCLNYEVSEIGCYGNKEPCEHLALDMQEYVERIEKMAIETKYSVDDLHSELRWFNGGGLPSTQDEIYIFNEFKERGII